MDLDLGGKIAVVTGAQSACGGAALAARVLRCTAGARTVDTLADSTASPLQLDLAKPGGPEALVAHALERHGRVDVLVNNVAGAPRCGWMASSRRATPISRRPFQINFST